MRPGSGERHVEVEWIELDAATDAAVGKVALLKQRQQLMLQAIEAAYTRIGLRSDDEIERRQAKLGGRGVASRTARQSSTQPRDARASPA